MRQRTLLNLALIGLVAAIAIALWLSPVQEDTPAPPLIAGVKPGDIDTIRVQRPGDVDMRFRRTGGAWRMVEPVAAPAHEARIDALLGLLADQSLARLPATDLARFGLETPAMFVELGPHRIAFGDPHPIDAKRYVLLGDTVHLVPDSLYAQLTQNAGFFIDNHLLPSGTRPTYLRYPAFSLEPGEKGWRESPPSTRDAAALLDVIDGWTGARALAVLTPAKSADSHGTIEVRAGGESIEFEITALSPAPVLARRDLDIQYHLDSFTAEQLLVVPGNPASPAD
jgi:hypothetical protein